MSIITPDAEAPAGGANDARVVIVDDHELLRTGTKRILEEAAGFTVVGEAEDGETALAVIDSRRPDLVLVDIRLPAMNGIELARQILTRSPAIKVVILSAYDDDDYVRAARSAGVAGYLLKTTPSPDLVHALGRIWAGERVLDPSLAGRVDGSPRTTPSPTAVPGSLTARERAVVSLVARGLSNKAIAQDLKISPRTVEGHLNHVFEKLDATSRTELVHVALTSGLLDPTWQGGETDTT